MGPDKTTKPVEDIATKWEDVVPTLKEEINNFLFAKVPGIMTISEFEDLACDIMTRIHEAWFPTEAGK